MILLSRNSTIFLNVNNKFKNKLAVRLLENINNPENKSNRAVISIPETSLEKLYVPSVPVMAVSEFPKISLVPKAETGVLNFLQKYPKYNGKNVTIAIFDSGIDPNASGLKNISDGTVKVIERYDCSGCGDTDTSKKVTASGDGTIIGLSGKSLKLTDFMKNSNRDGQEYRVGLKSLYDLYPTKVRTKVSSEEKLKIWDEPHKTAIADVNRLLSKIDSQSSDTQNLTLMDKLKKDDLENSLEFLNNYEKKFMDIRTTYDCILFRAQNGWMAVIDTTECGDLQNAVLLGEYNQTYETKKLDNFLSISINVHDEGNVLEIVGMCTSHGTHVASIASGNNMDKELDGMAPDAKIISLTIGDGRLGSMETGTALVRAMMKVMELCKAGKQIDVINMSYGEHGNWSNYGRIGELMNEVVNKYGVVWVASAGNHGPALCTIGTPPDISESILIGVGAYVSPQMMEAEYTLREKLPGNVYTWTSRDPCIDGGRGVTVCAPGAAIASVPEYTMSKAQLMNGTSMAAPHVAGAVALLISGLKDKNIPYSPHSIKRALTESATKVNYIDEFAQGAGLLNVEKAFDHLVQYCNEVETMMRFSIRVGVNSKGIHIRKGAIKKPSEHNVVITPIFFNEKEVDPKLKINFNVRLNLVTTQPWVHCGSFLDLCYSARTISVKVDPVGLPPGVHTASVIGYDTSCIEKGALFEIPVTIVQPHLIDLEKTRIFSSNGAVEFKPNAIQRDFILVPNNATWAIFKMCSVDDKENQLGKFFIHTMQVLPMRNCKNMETMKILPVNCETDTVHAFKVQGNIILELCIAKYWSNFGTTKLKYSLEFHGITSINPNANIMFAALGVHRIDITPMDGGIEDACPNIQFKTASQVLKLIENKISPLSPVRDVIPDGRQIYENILTYNLHLNKSTEIAIFAPMLYTVLYESEYESQLWMLFDSNKMLLHCGDAYSDNNFVKLEKGDYTIRLQIRHEKKDMLEKLNEINVLAIFKIQPLALDFYNHYNLALTSGKKILSIPLENGCIKTIYIPPFLQEKLSKASVPSQASWLNGILAYPKDELGRKVDQINFQYVLNDSVSNNKNSSNNSNNTANANTNTNNNNSSSNLTGSNGGGTPKKTKTEEFKEALRDLQCSHIVKLDYDAAEKLYKEVLEYHPKHLAVHLMLIQNLEGSEPKNQHPFSFHKFVQKTINDELNLIGDSKNIGGTDDKLTIDKLNQNLLKIIDLANIIIDETNSDSLLAYYGIKNDTRTDAAKIKTKMDKQKFTLLEALCKKGTTLCKLKLIGNEKNDSTENKTSTDQLDEIDSIYVEISKFIDPSDSKVVNFSIWHAHSKQHYGRMVKYLQKLYDEKLNRDILDEICSVTQANNWKHMTKYIAKIAVSANPMGYRLF